MRHREDQMAELVGHLSAGTVVDLIPDRPRGELLAESEMRAWSAAHDIDASVLRDLLRGVGVSDPDPRGVHLRGARIRGRLDLDRVTTTAALFLEDCLLDEGITADAARLPALRLYRCRIAHPDEPAIRADALRVDTVVALVGSTVSSNAAAGAVLLGGARIGGNLNCTAASLHNAAGPSLLADRVQVEGNAILAAGFAAHGHAAGAAISLRNARIGGNLDCHGASVDNPAGAALTAGGLQLGGDMIGDRGFSATGFGRDGAVSLVNARLGNRLDFRGADLHNTAGPALAADGAHVERAVFLNLGFTADGAGPGGAVRLLGARIVGRLNCRAGTIRNPTGPALVADGLHVGQDALLDEGFTARGHGEVGAVRLRNAQIGGEFLWGETTAVNTSAPRHRWVLTGLTYSGVPRSDSAGDDRAAWLTVLREATPAYGAQPYQHLAAAYRALGHDRDVRAILMAQRRDQMERGQLSRSERSWAGLTGLLLGYGYQPWRALVALAAVLAVSVILALVLGASGALAITSETSTAAGISAATTMPCTPVQTIARGLDLGTPFLPTARSTAGTCDTTTSTTGDVLTIARWFLQLAAWALAALFIAGFTGIVRKT